MVYLNWLHEVIREEENGERKVSWSTMCLSK